VVSPAPRLYVDASLVAGGAELDLAHELGFEVIVVDDPSTLPADLATAWHLSDGPPAAGSRHWSRTVAIGPRPEPGRIAQTGLRTARDVRVAVLELASEAALD
jgi:hypothetical protein